MTDNDIERIIKAIAGVRETLGWIALWCFFIMWACCEVAAK